MPNEPNARPESFWGGWQNRLRALRNVPPVLGILWEAGRGAVAANLILRTLTALIPVAVLAVGREIIDIVVETTSNGRPVPQELWWWVAAEFALAGAGALLGRSIDYVDSVLADKFTRHLSVKIMAHASRLDLASYEDPVFYDKLERARVQATDRLGMIQAIGRLLQQGVTTVGLGAAILTYSPWLLVVLIACVLPAFLGESHFAFLGYSLNFRQTPARRQLDYLRVLGASRESAKELKLFGLSSHLTGRYQRLSDEIFDENIALAKKRLAASTALSMLTILGYYSCYAFGLGSTLTLNYADSYRDIASDPNRRVGSWTTFNWRLGYEWDEEGWLGGSELSISVQNLFDRDPPFLNNAAVGIGYDQENADLIGRFIRLHFRKNW